MKKSFLFGVSLLIAWMAVAQQQVSIPATLTEKTVQVQSKGLDDNTNPLNYVPAEARAVGFTEEYLGGTVYDLQSNNCSPFGRLIMFDDGTISAVWTRGMNSTAYSDRGTGYNYFDGSSWAAEPSARVETVRTGWPSIAQLGTTGEVIIAHGATGGLVMNKRDTKGSGAWTQSTLPLPSGVNTVWWSRMVTGGEDKNTVHAMVLTLPSGNGGVVYQGLDGALLYYRSQDGGATWDKSGVILDGMTSTEYFGIGADSYAWAEPQGDKLAFVVCDPQNDMFIMKSEDNGDTWQKTVIWEHPYPHLNAGVETDTLWGPDGAASLVYDMNGKLHLAFGAYRLIFTASGYSFWPGLAGIVYWNEDMPTFTGGDQMTILHIDSLDAKGLQIGYYNLDWNGNGELDIIDGGGYNVGWASWPQLAFDGNKAILVYSALMENFDNGTQNYRHILARASSDNAATWGPILDVTDDPVHLFDECSWPVLCNKSDELNWYFTYQYDNEPGTSIGQDADPAGDNYINFYHLSKILNRTNDNLITGGNAVSGNYPNPATESTTVQVTLENPAPVSLSIISLTGKVVRNMDYGLKSSGKHMLEINVTDLESGLYLYRVNTGQQSFTRKMAVKR